ncbi:MAG: hypothetical protein ABI288_03600 [Ginsengibacter sp.]
MKQQKSINEELIKITNLLQDTGFALDMAKNQEAAYYTALGQSAPAFLSAEEENTTVEKSAKEEKIATNIAAFYAVECGIGLLMEQHGGTPVEWLNKIVNHQLDSSEILVLNRFANATWQAGQPFRGLQRIKKDNFISPVFLSNDEIKKDYDQVTAASEKLLPAMQIVVGKSANDQLHKLSELLKNEQFAMGVAQYIEAAYHKALNEPVPDFLKAGEDTATFQRSFKEEKIATNIAGFYALECGISYLATVQHLVPSDVLRSIAHDSLSKENKRLFERFANAAWKAGQPFRGLDRITRETFTCFDLLPPDEVEKDWIQIKTAAVKLISAL